METNNSEKLTDLELLELREVDRLLSQALRHIRWDNIAPVEDLIMQAREKLQEFLKSDNLVEDDED